MKIAVFVSGGGTNLQAIIDNTKDGILKDIEISLVLSSSKTAYALERAADNGIKSAVVSKKDFDSIESWDDAVLAAVEDSGAELIVLAGYLSLMERTISHIRESLNQPSSPPWRTKVRKLAS